MSDSIKSQLKRLRPLLKTNASKQRMMSVFAGLPKELKHREIRL